jgi:hypothetical protein
LPEAGGRLPEAGRLRLPEAGRWRLPKPGCRHLPKPACRLPAKPASKGLPERRLVLLRWLCKGRFREGIRALLLGRLREVLAERVLTHGRPSAKRVPRLDVLKRAVEPLGALALLKELARGHRFFGAKK